MRILAAADIHGVLFVYEWLAEIATGKADMLVLAGDLFDADFEKQQRRQAQKILQILKGIGKPVLYLMGNDDNVPLDYEDANIQSVHGRRIEINGFGFVGYEYTPPFVGDRFVKPEAEIEADLRSLAPLIDPQTVFITHSPALGELDTVYEDHVGSSAIADFIAANPVLAHIHGHIHERFGRQQNHFNVASAGRCRAMLIDLPSLAHSLVSLHNVAAAGS